MHRLYNEERHQKANAFGILLAAQLFLILMPAIFEYLHWGWIEVLSVVLIIFTSLYISTTTKRDFLVGLGLGIVAAILLLIDAPNPSSSPLATLPSKVLSLATILVVVSFFIFVAVKLAQQVVKVGVVNLNTVLATITGYIYIGIVGGYLVQLVQTFTPTAFNIEPSANAYSYLYFSFVTITTLGYGDIAPQESVGEAISIVLVIAGQMYLTVVIALIIGQFIANRPR